MGYPQGLVNSPLFLLLFFIYLFFCGLYHQNWTQIHVKKLGKGLNCFLNRFFIKDLRFEPLGGSEKAKTPSCSFV